MKKYKFSESKWMPDQFAKIVEVEDKQVVVMKDWDNDEDREILWTLTQIDGVLAQARFGFVSAVERDGAFTDYGVDNAKSFVEGTKNLISGKS